MTSQQKAIIRREIRFVSSERRRGFIRWMIGIFNAEAVA